MQQSSLRLFARPQSELDEATVRKGMSVIRIPDAACAKDYVDVGAALLRLKRHVEAVEVLEQAAEHVRRRDPFYDQVVMLLKQARNEAAGQERMDDMNDFGTGTKKTKEPKGEQEDKGSLPVAKRIRTDPSSSRPTKTDPLTRTHPSTTPPRTDNANPPSNAKPAMSLKDMLTRPPPRKETAAAAHTTPPDRTLADASIETLVTIFQHLSLLDLARVAQVCRQFRMASNDAGLYRSLDLSMYAPRVKNAVADRLIALGGWNLRKLNLTNCDKLNEFSLQPVRNGLCPNLVDLNLGGCYRLAPEILVDLIKAAAPQLQRVVLAACDRTTDAPVAILLRRADKLAYLDLSDLTKLTDAAFAGKIAAVQLKHVVLSGCTGVSDDGIAALLQTGLPHLRSLVCHNCPRITNRTIKTLGGGGSSVAPQLRVLDLTGSGSSYAQLPIAVRSALPNIAESMLLFAASCEHLVRVCLPGYGLTDEAIDFLVSSCGKLELLDLDGNSALSDASLMAIAQNCPFLQGLSINMCARLTDVGVFNLAAHCTRLTMLSFSNCPGISDRALSNLSSLPLRALSVQQCQVTARGVEGFMRQCRTLKQLDISFCYNITSAQAHALRSVRRDVNLLATMEFSNKK